MAIRYDKKFMNEINRIVKSYNAKITRLSKMDNDYLLPSKFTKDAVATMKATAVSRADIRRRLKDLQSFTERGGEKTIRVGRTSLPKYQYSNTGYILLGLIISKVTNRELNEYIETEIFKPAKMDNSKVNLEGITKISNRAYGHIIDNDNYIVKDQYWCSATIGDGGLYSSINDLKRWCKYLNNSVEFKDMKVPNIVGNYDEYGLGIRIVKVNDKEFYFHSGSTIGTNTLLLFSVDLDLCFLFLTNINGFSTTKIKELFVEYLLSEDC